MISCSWSKSEHAYFCRKCTETIDSGIRFSFFDTIETKWRTVFSKHFVLGKTVLLYVKSSWSPRPLKCLSSIRAPARFKFLCAAGGCFQKVYPAPAWSRIDERQFTPCQYLSQSTPQPLLWSMKNLNVVMLPVSPILSMQLVTLTILFHFLIS